MGIFDAFKPKKNSEDELDKSETELLETIKPLTYKERLAKSWEFLTEIAKKAMGLNQSEQNIILQIGLKMRSMGVRYVHTVPGNDEIIISEINRMRQKRRDKADEGIGR